jgi:hypothetical protein
MIDIYKTFPKILILFYGKSNHFKAFSIVFAVRNGFSYIIMKISLMKIIVIILVSIISI